MKYIVILIFIIAGIGSFFAVRSNQQNPNSIKTFASPTPQTFSEIKASFLIFTNGTRRDFNFERYFNQSEEVYIQASSPTTVIVKKQGITWDDFFKTLPMGLTKDCLTTGTGQEYCTNSQVKLSFYINGKETNDFLEKEINNNDKALIRYGPLNQPAVENELLQIPTP